MQHSNSNAPQQEQQAGGEEHAGLAWPFKLPAPAAAAVAAKLPLADRKHLRLASKAAQRFVDAHAKRLRLQLQQAGSLLACGPLAQRFPCVESLKMDGGIAERVDEVVDERLKTAFSQPWPSVTTLEFNQLPVGAVALLVGACANVERCTLGHYGNVWPAGRVPGRLIEDSINSVCGGLARLKHLGLTNPIGDEELLAISKHSGLTSLKAALGDCSVGAWRALMDMQQLVALDLSLEGRLLPPRSVFASLEQMPALAALSLCMGPRPDDWGPVPQLAFPKGVLRLPASLESLSLMRVPLPATASLPNLTTLKLDGELKTAGLAALAAAPLMSLTVGQLSLTARCHKAPLLALTQLVVTARCSADADTRLALLCPALRSLSLCCGCLFGADAALLEGLGALECLDGSQSGLLCDNPCTFGAEMYKYKGLSLDARGMAVLAALPRLVQLTLNAEAAHVGGLSALTRLEQLKLVFDGEQVAVSRALAAALDAASVPASLRSAAFVFELSAPDFEQFEVGGGEEEEEELEMYEVQVQQRDSAFQKAAEALLLMLARSPGPAKVTWAVDEAKVAAMTSLRLWALAGNPCIKRIEVVGGKGAFCPPAVAAQVMSKHVSRGFKVVQCEQLA